MVTAGTNTTGMAHDWEDICHPITTPVKQRLHVMSQMVLLVCCSNTVLGVRSDPGSVTRCARNGRRNKLKRELNEI